MFFKQIKLGNMDNFSYVIGDEETKKCMVVDPGFDADKLIDACDNYNVVGILITHVHFDHIQDLAKAVSLTNAPVFVHESGVESIKYGEVNSFKDGNIVKVGGLDVKVIHTPGHNPSCVCLLVDNKLITGDTLFVGGCGRCDLPGSDVEAQWDSLQKLKLLDDNIEVYAGHDYGSKPSSTIGYEKKNNDFMTADREKFVNVRMGS